MIKNLPAMQETQVWSQGQEDPLKEEMAAHSIILAWRIPWTEEPGRLLSMGSQRLGHDWATFTSLHIMCASGSLQKHVGLWDVSSSFLNQSWHRVKAYQELMERVRKCWKGYASACTNPPVGRLISSLSELWWMALYFLSFSFIPMIPLCCYRRLHLSLVSPMELEESDGD